MEYLCHLSLGCLCLNNFLVTFFRNPVSYTSLSSLEHSSEGVKVGFHISLLQEEPQAWAHHLQEQHDAALSFVDSFFSAMTQLYADPFRLQTAESMLSKLCQGQRPVEDYVSDFHLCADTECNSSALRFQFHPGLAESLKDELAQVGVPIVLEDLITLSIQIDRRLREGQLERSANVCLYQAESGASKAQPTVTKSKDSSATIKPPCPSYKRSPLSQQE